MVQTQLGKLSVLTCMVIYVAFAFANAEDVEVEGKNICDSCFCDDNVEPYFIRCEHMQLTEMYSEDDWNSTMEFILEKNITDLLLDFRIDGNELTHVTKFPALIISQLSLADNKIATIDDSAFAELDYLNWLDLSINELTAASLTEKAFQGKYNETYYFPISVKHLNLSRNNIHVIDKDLFDHLPYLITLDLSHNPLVTLSGGTAVAIASLSYLQALTIRHASLTDIPEGMLHALLHLIVLDMSNNKFTKVPTEISYSHNLTALDLSGNKFEELNQTSFVGLDHIEELYLNYIPTLKHIGSATFGPLKKLRKIEITFNRNLDDISDAAFFGMVSEPNDWPVKEIYLNDNGLTHIDQSLAAWEFVDLVDIQSNPFRCDCRLDWMTQVLVDKIRRQTPLLTNDIVCAEPKEMKGKAVISLLIEPLVFIRCRAGETEINGDSHRTYDKDPYQTAGVTILVIGIMLIVIGVSILGVLFIKRRAIALALMNHQQIRYERTGTEEIEYTNRYSYDGK